MVSVRKLLLANRYLRFLVSYVSKLRKAVPSLSRGGDDSRHILINDPQQEKFSKNAIGSYNRYAQSGTLTQRSKAGRYWPMSNVLRHDWWQASERAHLERPSLGVSPVASKNM